MIIGIEINRQFLQLDTEMQYAFDQTHPAFQDEFDSGNHTFPIDIPALGINELILNIPAHLNALDKSYKYDCFIWLHGNRWKPGKLVIDSPGTE